MYSPEANQPSLAADPPPPGGGGGEGGGAAGGGNVPLLPDLPPGPAPHHPAAGPVPTTPACESLVRTLAPRNEVERGEEARAQHEQVRGPSSGSSNPQSKIPNPKSVLPSDLESLLLLDAAAGILDAPQIAAKHNLALALYLDWYSSATTATRLSALLSSRDHVRVTKYQVFQDEAAATLRELHTNAAENPDPVERRRSATALLRFTTGIISGRASPARLFASMGIRGHNSAASSRNPDAAGLSLSRFPSHFRTRSRKVRTVPILHESPVILPDAHIDALDESASPSEATIQLLHRLQNSDNPRAGDGLRCLFHRFTPDMKAFVEARTADEFACTPYEAYHSLIAHHSAVLHPIQIPEPAPSEDGYPSDSTSAPTRAVQTVDLIDLDGDRITGEFCFTRDSPSAPWLINELNISVKPDTEPEPSPPNTS